MISAELQPEPNLEMTMDDQEALSFELDGTVVLPTTAGALVDLADVQIASPVNNQVLKYNSTTEKWVNGADTAGVSDVMMDGNSVVTSGVANLPKAGANSANAGGTMGVIKTSTNYYGGIVVNSDGQISVYSAPSDRIVERRQNSVIVASNYDYAVKQAIASTIGTGSASLNIAYTDTEKQNVWTRFNIVKTTLDNVLVPCAQYYLGEQSSLTLTLPSIANAGQMITVDFASGNTPTSLNISGNVAGDITYAPEANTLVEINFKFDGTYWKMLVSSVEKPSE